MMPEPVVPAVHQCVLLVMSRHHLRVIGKSGGQGAHNPIAAELHPISSDVWQLAAAAAEAIATALVAVCCIGCIGRRG